MVRAVHLGRLTSHVRDVRRLLDTAPSAQLLQLSQLLRSGTAMCRRWTGSCVLEGRWAHPRPDTSLLEHHVAYTKELVLLIKSALPHLSSVLLFEFVSYSGVVLSMWPSVWPNAHILANPSLLHQLHRFLSWLSDAVSTGAPVEQDTLEADILLMTVSLGAGATAPPGYLQHLCHLAYTALGPAVNSFQHKPNPLMGLHLHGRHSPATMILPRLLHLVQHSSTENRHEVAALIITMIGSIPRSLPCEFMLRTALSIYTPILQAANCTHAVRSALRTSMLSFCVRTYPALMHQCVACMIAAWQSSSSIDACSLCLQSTIVNFRNSSLHAGLRPLLFGVMERLMAGNLPPHVVTRLQTACAMPGMLATCEAMLRWDSRVMNLPTMLLQAARLLLATVLPADNSPKRFIRLSSMSVTMMKLLRTCAVPKAHAQAQAQAQALVHAQQAETVQLLLTTFQHISQDPIQNTQYILKARISLALLMVEMLARTHLPQPIRLAVRAATFTLPALCDKTEWLCNLLPSMHGRVLPGCCFLHCDNLAGACEAALKTSLCRGCMCSRYCSVRCQRADWVAGDHKLVCGQGKWTPAAASAIAAARVAATEALQHALRDATAFEAMAVSSLKAVQIALADAEAAEAHAISTVEESQVTLSLASVAASHGEVAAAKAEASLEAAGRARAAATEAAGAVDAVEAAEVAEALAAVDFSAAAVVVEAAKVARARADAVIRATTAVVSAARVMARDLAATAAVAAAAARAASKTSRTAMAAAREAGVV